MLQILQFKKEVIDPVFTEPWNPEYILLYFFKLFRIRYYFGDSFNIMIFVQNHNTISFVRLRNNNIFVFG